MRDNRFSRWFAAGITGTLFAIIMLTMAVPVAADGLVTVIPGQDPNANVIVVSSPGYVNNGTATIPANINNGFAFCTANACYPAGTVCTVNGCGIQTTGVCNVAGCGVPVCAVNGCFGPTCTVYGCVTNTCGIYGCGGGNLGVTAAGPIVGIDGNGNPVVYDVRGGSYDTYTRDANGRVCEADSRGNCQKT